MTVRQGFTVEGDADLAEALAFAADHGFDFVESNRDYAFAPERVDSDRVRVLADEHGDRIAHVHLSTRRGDGGEDEHLPVGIGGKPFEELTAAMRETDWEGTATHEVFGFDHEFVALGKENVDGWLAGA
jgi:sugar phosphate isomerase/epimerase